MTRGKIRIGIGGWTYPPWRSSFYPPDLPQKRELEYASRQFGALEINATFYGRQSPKSWKAWAETAHDDFQFAVKGSRYCVTRPKLAEAAEGLAVYFAQGLSGLGPKLGPVLWTLASRRQFDAEDIEGFFDVLPTELDGIPLRHAIEPRHESFRDERFFDLCRKHDVAVVYGDDEEFPCIDADTASFAYARLQCMQEDVATGYRDKKLDEFAERIERWIKDGRDAYAFMINGAKVRAPAAALALQERLR
jgi:uncharacterized protein YecE (DUF72 family)